MTNLFSHNAEEIDKAKEKYKGDLIHLLCACPHSVATQTCSACCADQDIDVAFMDWSGYEFKYMTKHFPNSMWVELDFNGKTGWGRAWINPAMDLTAFGAYFEQKGYKIIYLSKNNWALDAD